MPLYLVTVSYHYYPEEGTKDWHFVTDSESAARAYFQTLELGETTAYLIRLSAEGYAVVDSRGENG